MTQLEREEHNESIRRSAKLASKQATKRTIEHLEDLHPKPTGKEALLEKKKQKRMTMNQFKDKGKGDDFEIDTTSLMSSSSFQETYCYMVSFSSTKCLIIAKGLLRILNSGETKANTMRNPKKTY